MLVDFHMHSVFSDGCLSPRELVDQGRLHGLRLGLLQAQRLIMMKSLVLLP